MITFLIFILLYSVSIVISFLAYGLFLVKFPHDKFWFTRELELADEGRRFKKNTDFRANIFGACVVWPLAGLVVFLLAFFTFLAMASDKAFCFMMEKFNAKEEVKETKDTDDLFD